MRRPFPSIGGPWVQYVFDQPFSVFFICPRRSSFQSRSFQAYAQQQRVLCYVLRRRGITAKMCCNSSTASSALSSSAFVSLILTRCQSSLNSTRSEYLTTCTDLTPFQSFKWPKKSSDSSAVSRISLSLSCSTPKRYFKPNENYSASPR